MNPVDDRPGGVRAPFGVASCSGPLRGRRPLAGAPPSSDGGSGRAEATGRNGGNQRLDDTVLADAFTVLDGPGSRLVRLLAHPIEVAKVVRVLRSKPVLEARLTRSTEGEATRNGLLRHSRLSRFIAAGATAVLVLPDDADAYERGGVRKTLRWKRRWAERQGVTWRRVSAASERAELLAAADGWEHGGTGASRADGRSPNEDMLLIRRWFAAFSADGSPLLLAVVSRDGDWAALRYFRTLASTREASAARFLMMSVLVRELGVEGVRYLALNASPLTTARGLRLFQYEVGFDLYRVLVRRATSD